MIIKCFEVRDRGTFVPVVAIKMVPIGWPSLLYDNQETYLLRRAGYGFEHTSILLCRMEASGTHSMNATYDPWAWDSSSRTMNAAHQYIEKNFDKLDSGDVIDVEFILGETKKKKISERLSHD
jgi:hypothetical protein